jgi:hypothetical protein
MNEMATILDFLKFYIDAKVVGTSKLGMMGILAMPGFSFQLIGNESGPAILLLDASAGFNISFKNGVAECFGGGLTFRLSRNIGLTGFYTYIPIKESFGNWDIAGPLYGFQVNFIL